jgi:hypothetical protein
VSEPDLTAELDAPWYNDDDIEYTVKADHWPAGGGPGRTWPEHWRVAICCSACGRIQSQPPETDLMDLVIAAADHHQRKHGGSEWRPPAAGGLLP